MIVQSVQSPYQRILLGWVFETVGDEQRFTPDGHYPLARGRHLGVASEDIGPGETVLEMPQGEILDAGHMRGKTPMDCADGSHNKSGSQPVTAPEPPKAPDSRRQPLTKESEPAVPMTSTQPEACLLYTSPSPRDS